MKIVLRGEGWLISFVQNDGFSSWGYLRAYGGNFSLNNQEPAFSVQDTGLYLNTPESKTEWFLIVATLCPVSWRI
jgi:hypothetical protein